MKEYWGLFILKHNSTPRDVEMKIFPKQIGRVIYDSDVNSEGSYLGSLLVKRKGLQLCSKDVNTIECECSKGSFLPFRKHRRNEQVAEGIR